MSSDIAGNSKKAKSEITDSKYVLEDIIILSIAVRTESTRVAYKLTQSSITREDKSFTGS